MSNIAAPIADKLLDDGGKLRPSWVEYFSASDRGDVGTTWSPTVVDLISVGVPTISGVYYQNYGFTDFVVKIVPATSVSSTLGTTTIALPFGVTADVVANTVAGSGVFFGIVNAASRTLFLPTLSAVTFPITIAGTVKN